MIYKFRKYKDIDSFIKNIPKTKNDEEYTIVYKCNGLDFSKPNPFTQKCFGCLFCIFNNDEIIKYFNVFWGDDFINKYSKESFQGKPVTMPTAKKSLKNPIKNLEEFTGVDETSNIQPWTSGIINHMCSTSNRVGMEVPIYNNDYDRNGRLDVCSMTSDKLLAIETKISLDDALKDERFIEQHYKYTTEIEKSITDYYYITLFGGKETDLYPPTSPYCTGKIGSKSERFYEIVTTNNIKFISANALWCLCCRYLEHGDKYSWDIFISKLFSESHCIGLLSAGKVVNRNDIISIESF